MLENDFGLTFARGRYTAEQRRAERRFRLRAVASDSRIEVSDSDEDGSNVVNPALEGRNVPAKESALVSFDVFCSEYWPHFPQNLTKKLGTLSS